MISKEIFLKRYTSERKIKKNMFCCVSYPCMQLNRCAHTPEEQYRINAFKINIHTYIDLHYRHVYYICAAYTPR